MSHERLRLPPSAFTGEQGVYLYEVWRAINGIPTMSYFSGSNPNSILTGTAGHLAVNVGTASTDSRFWIKGGDAAMPSTTNWSLVGGGGGGPASQLDADGTTLDVNTITDGEVLKRVGTTIVSVPVGAPGAHASTHEDGGADEVDVGGLSGVLADPQPPIIGAGATQAVAGNDARLTDARTPTAHATSHQNGGSDEISVAGLSGLLADGQTPLAHVTSHQLGGSDALSYFTGPVSTNTIAGQASAITILVQASIQPTGSVYGPAGTALRPVYAYSSETSLGWYRSGASTMALSYGTALVNTLWATSGVSAKGSIVSSSYVSSDRTVMGSEVWSSGFSALGSIVSSSWMSSLRTVLAGEVWSSGFSALGSIVTASYVSSNRSVIANEVWSSGVSALASIGSFSYASSSRTAIASEVWSSGISAKSSIGSFSYTSSSRTAMASEMWSSGFSALGSIVTASWVSSARTVLGTEVWSSGFSAVGSIVTSSYVSSSRTVQGVEVWSSGFSAVGSIVTSSYVSSSRTVQGVGLWGSGLSIGNATAGGSLIPAISSTSSTFAAFVVQGSSSSFRVLTWAQVQPGDVIIPTILPSAAVSSMSSGLVPHSHCTQAGQFEFRLSNCSTLVQNQSARTWLFVRISPF